MGEYGDFDLESILFQLLMLGAELAYIKLYQKRSVLFDKPELLCSVSLESAEMCELLLLK